MTEQDATGASRARYRIAASRILLPVQEFVRTETAGGVILLLAALGALIWANSPVSDDYFDLIHEVMSLDLIVFSASEDLKHWINDGAMVVFFFVVGLEIKRELFHGELASPRKAALPIAAAIGGMAVPAVIYVALNSGGAGADGWGIPMATDIAFAVGILALLGNRIPSQVRIFLLSLAIVDDIGAIVIIAVFYTGSIELDSLAIAVGTLALVVGVQRSGARNVAVYLLLGVIIWAAVYESGIHATIAGVVLGLLTPSHPYVSREGFAERNSAMLSQYRQALATGDVERVEAILGEIEETATNASAPLERLERLLHPWSSFLVIPLFAFANSGVELSGRLIEDAAASSVTFGVAIGLLAGKVLGVVGATWLATRLRLADLPDGTTWSHILGVSILAGIGFTVSLFITELAFDRPDLVDQAKIGILCASTIAGIAGYSFLRLTCRRRPEEPVSA